ncbi:MAG: hypothetical protein Q4F65_12070 [Propionibacteriaceae bacterium]|nr:hypothetical protein [Propionibacteriaceae bacterium]
MDTWTTPDDVKTRWIGTAALPDDTIIQAWIEDAETLIFAEFPDLADRLTDDPNQQWRKRVTYVAAQLTIQALKNPDGVRQQAQTAGAFTNSVTFGTETISQAMSLTPAHRALLQVGRVRHVGIDMTPPPPAEHPLDGSWVNGPDHLAPGGVR